MKHVKLFFLIVLLSGISSVFAAEVVLAKYDFSTKSKTPTESIPGVTFGSEFGVWNTTTSGMEVGLSEDGYMVVKGSGTGVLGTRYGYISITPEAGKTIRITKTVIKHYKAEGSNTSRTRCYLYDMAAPKDLPTIKASLIYTGSGGAVIPSALTTQTFFPSTTVEFNAIRYMSLNATQNTADANLSQWKIQELTFYGNVLSPGDIINTDFINYGNVTLGNNADANVSLKVLGGTTENVKIEKIDPSNSFECLQTQVDAVDATAGTSIKVSYVPTVAGKHTAKLKFTYGDKVSYTDLNGICPVLNETFTSLISDPLIWTDMDSTKVNSYKQDDFLAVPGWEFNDSVYWHKSGSYGLGLVLRGGSSTVAKATTPELNLSAPFGLTFRSKKMSNRTTILGQLFVLADNDTIGNIVNPNDALTLQTIDGFIAKANSKISFVGIANDSSKVVVDEISVFPTSNPTLNIPAYSTKLFNVGTEPVIVDIPLKAYQLTTDVTVSTVGNAIGYEVLTPTILMANAEAGATIQVKYTPTVGSLTSANLTIKGGGLTDFRYLQLIANSSTGLKETKMNATIVGKTNAINIAVEGQTNLEVFTFDGKLIINKKISGNSDVHINAGLYIVKLTNNDASKIVKVVVK